MQKSLKVTIDPGHAPGNVNGGRNGYKEYAGMWKLSNYLKSALEKYPLIVELTRTEKADPKLTERGKIGAGSALFISEHSNAASDEGVRGVEVYYSVDLPGDKALAAEMARVTSALMQSNSRGAMQRESTVQDNEDFYTVIDSAQDSGAKHVLLIENGFHSNATDEAFLLKDENLKQIAEAQARIIANFLGVTLQPEAEAPAIPAMPPQDAPAAASKVKFNLFGQKTVEVTGRIVDNVSLVAARELLEAMEFVVKWDGDAQTVKVSVPT